MRYGSRKHLQRPPTPPGPLSPPPALQGDRRRRRQRQQQWPYLVAQPGTCRWSCLRRRLTVSSPDKSCKAESGHARSGTLCSCSNAAFPHAILDPDVTQQMPHALQDEHCTAAMSRTIGALPAVPPAGATAATAGGSDVPRLGTCIRRRPAAGCCSPAAAQEQLSSEWRLCPGMHTLEAPRECWHCSTAADWVPAIDVAQIETCKAAAKRQGARACAVGSMKAKAQMHACICGRRVAAGDVRKQDAAARPPHWAPRRLSCRWRPSRHAAVPLRCGMFRALQQGAEPIMRFPGRLLFGTFVYKPSHARPTIGFIAASTFVHHLRVP